jgi:pimeloyl-ACP methyl ester carboxylesterase
MAADVFALMDSLRIERFVLGGLSLGGYVSFACMRLAPRRIRGLILADTKAEADTPEQREAREATARFTLAHDVGALLDRDTPRLFWDQTINRKPEVVREARQIATESSAAGVAAVARGMALRPDSGPLLSTIRCPTLIIVGEHDAITPPDAARAMAGRILGSTLEVIPEVGHLSNLEDHDAFTTALTRYLEQSIPR